MKYFFEATRSDEVRAISLQAKNLSEGTRIFNAYLAGVNFMLSSPPFEMTSATAYKRKGVSYEELEL